MTDTEVNERQRDFAGPTANRFLCLLLLAEVLLIAATWPLWTTIHRFPAVPLLAVFCDVPVIIDQCCTFVLCLSAVAACIAIARGRKTELPPQSLMTSGRCIVPGLLISILSGCFLALLNQHRLQPWHWLFLLILVQALLLQAETRLALFRLTLASIYVFAAASRWGPDVDSGMSRQVLTVLLKAIDGESLLRNSSFVLGCCIAMSAVEFLTGVFLLTLRFRRLGIAAAIGMHATLIFSLSPWGLNHHLGVLVWNAFLLLAVPVLFAAQSTPSPIFHGIMKTSRGTVLAVFVVLFPLLGFFRVADNWLSWQVYSPRPEVVRVYVHEEFADNLPSDLRSFVGRPAPLDVWCPVRIDQWSLTAIGVPIYPEDRVQLAVAGLLMHLEDDPQAFTVQLEEPNPLPWRSRRTQSIGRAELSDRVSRFVLNGDRVRSQGWQPSP